MPADFDKQSYWRERFASETTFEWLVPSAEFMDILEPHLARLDAPSARILQLGSGTSDLQNHLRARGFAHVTSLDYEPLAVQRGRALERDAFGDVRTTYDVADVTQLRRPGDPYDLVVDKSTVDAVCCGGRESFLRMARGVRGCLAPGAAWISLSYSEDRFDVGSLPFDVEVIARIPAPKLAPTDPDVYHCCYLLTPR